MTQVYKLLKNIHFLDDPCSIQAYIKKRLFNSDLEAIMTCTNLTIPPTTYALLQKLTKPLLLFSDHSQC